MKPQGYWFSFFTVFSFAYALIGELNWLAEIHRMTYAIIVAALVVMLIWAIRKKFEGDPNGPKGRKGIKVKRKIKLAFLIKYSSNSGPDDKEPKGQLPSPNNPVNIGLGLEPGVLRIQSAVAELDRSGAPLRSLLSMGEAGLRTVTKWPTIPSTAMRVMRTMGADSLRTAAGLYSVLNDRVRGVLSTMDKQGRILIPVLAKEKLVETAFSMV